ncbi:MAG: caspase family protein [Caldilineaceae bacterium]|nr:caspase family protein [Caldilineaceae bacterium]
MNHFSQGHALLIGVSADLPGTVQDATGVAEILQDPARCAYPPQQVTLLIGEAARRHAILAALDDLAARTNADDSAIVYFSGHGYRVSSSFGAMHYLLPYGYDVASLPDTAISGLELAQKLAALPVGKLLLLLDCCHAGGLDNIKAPGAEFTREALPPEALTVLSQGRGHAVIASSRADELSLAGKPYSAFTLALIEALCGVAASTQDGYVRVADLAMYASNAVPRRTRDRQHPILNYKEADNFVVAYYAGGDEKPKGAPFAESEIEIESEPGTFNQRGQTVWGSQVNVAGSVHGPVVTGPVEQIGDRYETHYHTHEASPPPPFTLDLADLEKRSCRALPLTVTLSLWLGRAHPTWRRNGSPAFHRSMSISTPPANPVSSRSVKDCISTHMDASSWNADYNKNR